MIFSFLRVKILNVNLVGLMDAGASRTCINHATWEILRSQEFRLSNTEWVTCRLANGGCCDSIGTVTYPIALDDRTVILNILVVPALSEPVIFEVGFLRTLGIVMDRGWLEREINRSSSVPTICKLNKVSPAVMSRSICKSWTETNLGRVVIVTVWQVAQCFLATDKAKCIQYSHRLNRGIIRLTRLFRSKSMKCWAKCSP